MADYIDREKLLELINEDCKYKNPTNEYTRGCNEVCDWAIKTIKNIPTADVAPKSEVEKALSDFKKQIHDKAVYPHNAGISPYISIKAFDTILQNVLNKHTEE